MIARLSVVLFLSAIFLCGQPVTLTPQGGVFHSYGPTAPVILIGTFTDNYQLDYVAPSVQNLNPNTTDFVPATAGAVRVTKTGNPNLNNGLFPYYPFRLRVTMSPTAGQNYDVNFSISQRGYGSSAQVVVSYLYGAVDMNGLFVSGGDEVVILDSNTVSGSQVDIPLRVTRGRTRFTNPVSVTMPQGTVHTVEVGITTVGNLPYTQQYADGFVLSPGSTPGMSTLTLDLTGDKILAAGRYYGYLYVSAPGEPGACTSTDQRVYGEFGQGEHWDVRRQLDHDESAGGVVVPERGWNSAHVHSDALDVEQERRGTYDNDPVLHR